MRISLSRPLATAVRLAVPLALTVWAAGPAPAEDFYYVAMLASQREPNNPDYSHTFASFVHATGEGQCPKSFVVVDSFCISWLPRNLKVRTDALLPECGANFGLHDTIRYALDNGERVSLWGPYRIEKDLYDQAVVQLGVLESGRVKYKAVDSGYPTNRVSNCIHAVSSVDGGYRVRILSPGFGEMASWVVLQRFGPQIINPGETHEWVYSFLGLECYPIIRRDYDRNPRSGTVWSILKRVVGVEP